MFDEHSPKVVIPESRRATETESVAESTEPGPSDGETKPAGLSARANFWSTIVTAFAAAAALILSLMTYIQLNSRPDMAITMPRQMVVWSGKLNGGTTPAFCTDLAARFRVDRKTDLPSTVLDARMELEQPNGRRLTLPWVSLVRFSDPRESDPTTAVSGLTRVWQGLPSPITATQDAAGQSTMEYCTYQSGGNVINLVAGRWNGRLEVQRDGQDPLVQTFCIKVADRAAKAFNDGIQIADRWSQFWWPANFAELPAQGDEGVPDDRCYSVG
jgi:hypothetical protein